MVREDMGDWGAYLTNGAAPDETPMPTIGADG
jgi:hypothetical protein